MEQFKTQLNKAFSELQNSTEKIHGACIISSKNLVVCSFKKKPTEALSFPLTVTNAATLLAILAHPVGVAGVAAVIDVGVVAAVDAAIAARTSTWSCTSATIDSI